MSSRIRPLKVAEIDQAYALAQLAISSLKASKWRRFARRMLSADEDKRGGILIAEDGDWRFLGLLVYCLHEDLRHGLQLTIDPLVPTGISERHADDVTKSLIAAVEAIARSHGCASLTVAIESTRSVPAVSQRAEALSDLGFAPDTVTLYCRRLD